jgi:hypothetical protein
VLYQSFLVLPQIWGWGSVYVRMEHNNISTLRYLCGGCGSCATSRSPHLLKLDSDFCKGFNDDSNKHILKENDIPQLPNTGNEETKDM